MYMSIRTLDYVIFSHQANLSKTTKQWDGFVSHCTSRMPRQHTAPGVLAFSFVSRFFFCLHPN